MRRPSIATSPSTRTRPAAISSSQARREPIPTRARTFWRRSPSGSGVVRGRLDPETQRRLQVTLEIPGHLGPGKEVLHRRELLE